MLTPSGFVEEPEFYQQAKARGEGRYTALRALSSKFEETPITTSKTFSILNSQLNKAPRRSQHLSQFQPDRYILHTGGVVRLQTLKSPRRSLNRWIL
jgi:hypothetical protein